jgi:hypothetical protein
MERAIERSYKNYKTAIAASEIVKRIAIEHRLVVYGGIVYHNAIPGGIYKDWEIPDYDMYSDDNYRIGLIIYNELIKAGFDRVSILPGLFPDVVRIRVGIEFVADVKNVSQAAMKVYRDTATTYKGMLCRCIALQVADIFKVLGFPFEGMPRPSITFRWEKDFGRLLRIMEHHEFANYRKLFADPPQKKAKKLVPDMKEIQCGDTAYEFYMKHAGKQPRPLRHLSYLCTASKYLEISSDEKTRVHPNMMFADFMSLDGVIWIAPMWPLRTIKDSSARYVALDVLIAYYYHKAFFELKSGFETDTIHRYFDLLEIAQQYYPIMDSTVVHKGTKQGCPKVFEIRLDCTGERRQSAFELLRMENPSAAKKLVPPMHNFTKKYDDPKKALVEPVSFEYPSEWF